MRARWTESDGRQWYTITVEKDEHTLSAGVYLFGVDPDGSLLDSDGCPVDYNEHIQRAVLAAIEASGPDQVRELLAAGGLSQREAARMLGITDRSMRYYCSGQRPVQPAIMLALMHLVMCGGKL